MGSPGLEPGTNTNIKHHLNALIKFLTKTPLLVGSPKHFLHVICFSPPFFLKLFINKFPFKILSREFSLIEPKEIESSYAKQHGTTKPLD